MSEDHVLDLIAEGLVLLDDRLRMVFANSAAQHILGLQRTQLPARLPSEEVSSVAERAYRTGKEIEEVLMLWFPRRSTIKVRAVPLHRGSRFVLVLQDITEESLAQRVRREFVSHASHELKSPVAGIQTLAEAMQGAASTGDQQAIRRFSEKLMTESSRLGRLIGDLLDLSRLEDPAALSMEPVHLSSIANRELEALETQAIARSLRIENRIEEDVWVSGEPEQLSLLFRNLLENASRYTPEEGTIELGLTLDGDEAVVTVADTGIGIPTEAQGRVFERFYRVDNARSRARGGTGLGLAIVKYVAEMHGGGVAVESELGQGSTFVARLPATEPPSPPAASIAG